MSRTLLRWTCWTCGVTFTAWAKAQRHADELHSPGCAIELEFAEAVK